MVGGVPMTQGRFVLTAALVLSLSGCATRQFVRAEITRSEGALRPAVERLARNLQEQRAEMREIAAQTAVVRRGGEEATRAAIEALGMADVAAGRAADAVDHATIALRRADEAVVAGEQALAAGEATAERLERLWRSRARLSVVGAVVLRFRVDEWVLDDPARATLLGIVRRLRRIRLSSSSSKAMRTARERRPTIFVLASSGRSRSVASWQKRASKRIVSRPSA
jgi:hypothetical protein